MDINQVDDELRECERKGKYESREVDACGLREIKENARNVELRGSDSSSTQGKNSIDQSNDVQEDQKIAHIIYPEEGRKRKRNIMNDTQTSIIERALLEKPDMHRNATALQSWADRLSDHVCTNKCFFFQNLAMLNLTMLFSLMC